MAANPSVLGRDSPMVPAGRAEVGRFYRTPRGRLVQVTEVPPQGRKVRIRYWGMYGLGWQTMWLPGDSLLIPAPEVAAFPDPAIAEDLLLGGPVHRDAPLGE